jgi:CCR4-NOT transcription complex subunit 6
MIVRYYCQYINSARGNLLSYRFSLVREHLIEFNQMAKSSAEGSHEMLNRVFTKDNIGFAAFLEAKDGFWVHGTFLFGDI